MKIRFYKGNKTLSITETPYTAEYRLEQIRKQGHPWAMQEGIEWQIDDDIKLPKKTTTKRAKK